MLDKKETEEDRNECVKVETKMATKENDVIPNYLSFAKSWEK